MDNSYCQNKLVVSRLINIITTFASETQLYLSAFSFVFFSSNFCSPVQFIPSAAILINKKSQQKNFEFLQLHAIMATASYINIITTSKTGAVDT